jgi:WD40 repeat protein/serine/threonine protein kinase
MHLLWSNESAGHMSDPAGKTIKGYEIRKKLGEGGFGVVYLAYQAAIDREVAIKAIPPKDANQPDFIRRFEFEARTIARLEHPHIVPLFDYWRDPEGAYLVMRYLKGGSLTDFLHRGKAKREQILQIVDQVGSALQAAHRAGVIHRDLKPDNVLMDEEGNAYLADFGIAKVVGAQDDEIGTSGTPAYMSPEQITGSQLSPQTDMYAFGIILYELMAGQHPFAGVTVSKLIFAHIEESVPEIYDAEVPLAVNEVIQKATAKQSTERYADMQELVKEFRRALGNAGGDTVEIPEIDYSQLINPYKGLRAFQEEDQDDFFGRETLVDRLLSRLAEDSPLAYFLAVIGPSGSGKSSVVKAGLLPSLRRGYIPGSDTWYISEMVPGTNPLNNLEDALLRLATFPPAGISQLLRTNKNGLTLAAAEILKDTTDDVLLVIDQFEEIFTLCEDEAERTHFMELVRNAIADPDTRVHIIITLRADYIDRPLQYVDFGELIRQRMELVLPMSADELERAISAPAQRIGASVDSNLIAQIVADVREEPGALPLLQYALTEVFERRDGGFMTLGAYQDIGGVTGALAKRAEELYVELPADQGNAARQIFLRLITLGEGAGDTRRRVKRSELASIVTDPKVLSAVLDTFGKTRLLTFDRDADTRETTVEVAHEALIREWSRLHQWMDSSRNDIRLQRLLAAAGAEWENSNKDRSFLLSGSRLAQYEEWITQTDLALTPDERAYFDASVTERNKLAAEEKERQERERVLERQSAENAKRAANGLRIIAGVLAAGVIVALGLTGVAFNQNQIAQNNAGTATVAQGAAEFNAATATYAQGDAEQSRDAAVVAANIAQSGRIALQGVLELGDGHIDTALLLSVGALTVYDTREARSSLLTSLQSVPQLDTILYEHTAEVNSVAYHPDGTRFASADESGTILVWDTEERISIWLFSGHRGKVNSIVFSPDGRLLASAGDDGTIRLWNINTGETVGEPIGNLSETQIYSLVFTPDGEQLISGNSDGTIRIWDVSTGEQVTTLEAQDDERVYALNLSDHGELLASGGDYSNIILWRRNESGTFEQSTLLTGHTNWVNTLDISPDGTTIVSGSVDHTVRFWDIATGTQRGQPLTDHTDVVWSVAFSPDGATVATGSEDSLIILRDATTGQRLSDIAPLVGHVFESVSALAFSPDSQHLISGGEDQRVLLWTVPSRQPLSTLWTGHTSEVYSVNYMPDGTQVLSSSADTVAILWDAATGEILQQFPDPLGIAIAAQAISPDGTMFAFGMTDGRVRLLVNGEPGPTIAGHERSVRTVAFSPDGQTLASSGDDGVIIRWNTSTGEQIGEPLVEHEDVVAAIAFSPDGRWLASGSFDRTVLLWDLTATPPTNANLESHNDNVTALAFSPDGSLLASASRDRTVVLWDVATRALIGLPLTGHTDWVLGLSFSPDGQILASSSRDTTLILWDVASHQPIGQPLRGDHIDIRNSWMWSVAFSPDGLHLVTGSRDTTLRLWNVSLDAWRQRACDVANRSFSLTEWERYFGNIPYTNVCESNSGD